MQRMLRDMAIFCEICGRESMKSLYGRPEILKTLFIWCASVRTTCKKRTVELNYHAYRT
jgi:hypothetical protein